MRLPKSASKYFERAFLHGNTLWDGRMDEIENRIEDAAEKGLFELYMNPGSDAAITGFIFEYFNAAGFTVRWLDSQVVIRWGRSP